MNRFKVTHPWKATANTVLLVYNTCQCIKIFTFRLPGKCALDLRSVIKLEMKEEAVTREEENQDSGYNPSPPLVDLADTPDEDLSQLVSVLACHHIRQAFVNNQTPEVRGPPDSILTQYPHLRLTNTGALVLWNFLWALLPRRFNIFTW